ncbi:1,4-dihydroxy-6-naphthoate synthase [bacterium]|nr:1,4-dihydroxy-6-naphthoate synthase [bacterium]NUN46577.1 1,4-dihydroxy-6-naphthoate synthase [bacterium]
MKFTLGYSTCPNDTFIFDALVHKKIDTEGIEFEPFLADVEELNQKAFRCELDITKLSYHAFLYLLKDYALLPSGSALGHRCGPLFISARPINVHSIAGDKILIPGKLTTANFLLQFFLGKTVQAQPVLFSDIEKNLLNGSAEAGVIIHEGRFTYQAKGLHLIQDLGDYWETKTGMPIPLGAITIRKTFGPEIQSVIGRIIRRSVEYAFSHPTSSKSYVKHHAQELDDTVIAEHIKLYVNDYTLDLGTKGYAAVDFLKKEALRIGILPSS